LSVIAYDLVAHAKLTPLRYTLFAANRADLPVLGILISSSQSMAVSSRTMSLSLLGSDWLDQNEAKWDFAAGTIMLGDCVVHVHQRHCNGIWCRILETEDCVVLTKHEANILATWLSSPAAWNQVLWPHVHSLATLLDF